MLYLALILILGLIGYGCWAATITTLTTLTSSMRIDFQAAKANTGVGGNLQVQGSRSLNKTYTLGTGAGDTANQVIIGTLTIAGSGSNEYTLTGGTIASIDGTPTPTLTSIKEIIVELLRASQADQDGNVGTACSSITIGADAGTPWITGPFDATSIQTIFTGGLWHWRDPTGVAIAAGKQLKILNNDSGVSAKVQLTIIGVG